MILVLYLLIYFDRFLEYIQFKKKIFDTKTIPIFIAYNEIVQTLYMLAGIYFIFLCMKKNTVTICTIKYTYNYNY